MIDKTFHEIELEAWSARADSYDSMFASISTQAIGDTLKSLGDLRGKWLLDVACGTGHLVAAASEQGAICQGVDFAEAMIDRARQNYPTCHFQVAEAGYLPCTDFSLDAVTCLFGLSHMENPQAAVGEAFRVLRPWGRFAFTLWFGPDDGNDFLRIVQDSLSRFAITDSTLPANWTQLRFAEQARCESITQEAGFESPVFNRLSIAWQPNSAEEVADLFETISVRTKVIMERQPQAIQKQIRAAILDEVESRRKQGITSMLWPALLTVVRKPG